MYFVGVSTKDDTRSGIGTQPVLNANLLQSTQETSLDLATTELSLHAAALQDRAGI